jgi:hypothetical protein
LTRADYFRHSFNGKQHQPIKQTMKTNALLATLACVAALTTTAVAEQGGAGHYISGQQADFSTMPPAAPGWVFANYFVDYYDATASASKGLAFGSFIAANVTVNQQGEVPTLIYGYPFDFFGGTLSSGIIVPFVWVDVKAKAEFATPGGPAVSGTKKDFTKGLGDIELLPIMTCWTNGDFKFAGMFNVWAPTGDYQTGRLANSGLGYWTFEPMAAVSWLSSKIGTEVSIYTAVDFNTKNNDADYQSGDIFHVDGTVAQHLPLFGGFAGVGATAFYLKQITGDSGSGAKLGGFEVESYGVGPTISYVHPIGKSMFVFDASWLPQTHVENTVKGDFFWIKAAIAF